MPDLEEVFRITTERVRPAPGALDRQLGRQRRRVARQRVAVYALVVGLVVGITIGFGSLASDDERLGNPDPEPSLPVVEGLPPTTQRLEGIWLRDALPPAEGSPLLVRFDLDGTVAFDDLGHLDTDPAIRATYTLGDRSIHFTTRGGRACSIDDTWTWRAGVVPDEGRLHIVNVEDGTGNCSVGIDTAWSFTRVSPASPAGTAIAGELEPGAGPPTSGVTLDGIWLLEETGLLFRYRFPGGYAFDEEGRLGTDPFDVGSLELDVERATITFSSGSEARGCNEGDRMVWEDVRFDGDTLHAVVRRDDCTGRVGEELTWILIAHQ